MAEARGKMNVLQQAKLCKSRGSLLGYQNKEMKFVGRRKRKYWNGLKMNIRQISCKDGR